MAIDPDRIGVGAVIDDMPAHFTEASKLGKDIELSGPFTNIIVGGVGGSALPGDIVLNIVEAQVPLEVVRDYSLPKMASADSLIFVISYSGNTEETIALYREAVKVSKNVVALTSGGKLEELCKRNKTAMVRLPKGIQPRMAYPYMVLPILNILHENGMVPDLQPDFAETVQSLKKPVYKEPAKDLAKKLQSNIPLIYSSNKLKSVALKWKIDFNENSKTHAFWNVLPECNHNEIMGFERKTGEYFTILLRDDEEHFRIRKRMKVFKDILREKGIPLTEMVVRGQSKMAKVFSAIYIGDHVTYQLALLLGKDPDGVDLIEDLKKRIKI